MVFLYCHIYKVSLENGIVLNFDVRTLPSNLDLPSPARFTLSAHDGAVSSIDVNPHIKGCIVTGGTDKLVKVWNIADDEQAGKKSVSLVTSRDLGVVRFPVILYFPKYLPPVSTTRARSFRLFSLQMTLLLWQQRVPRRNCRYGMSVPTWAPGKRSEQSYARREEY